jgi:undecaprenyl-diphosphatase
VALGLMQGPAELLPVSSSAHTTLIPLLAGWRYGELDGERRKSFEVSLHAGAGLALALSMRRELARSAASLDRRRALALALALAPPAVAGLSLRSQIERRLGGARSIALSLIAGAGAMAVADTRFISDPRACGDAGALDGLALGIAQALALMPGVSRSGATITAARARGFSRAGARALSWSAAMPVLFAASALEGWRVARDGAPRGLGGAMAAGGGAAFLSTIACERALRRGRSGERSLLPYAVYRVLLGALVLRRLPRRAQ